MALGGQGRGTLLAIVAAACAMLGCDETGGQPVNNRDAAAPDLLSPVDVGSSWPVLVDAGTDAGRFTNDGERRGARTTTARVFASAPLGGAFGSVCYATDGSLIASGYTDRLGQTDFDVGGKPGLSVPDTFVARLDRQGNVMWAVGDGAGGSLVCGALLPDGASFLFATGSSQTARSAVVRIDGDGTRRWLVDFGPAGVSFASAATTAEGDVILVGTAQSTADLDPGPGMVFTTKLGPFVMKLAGATGELLWVRTPMDQAWINPLDLVLKADGRLLLRAVLAADKKFETIVTLAPDGTADPAGWSYLLPDAFALWAVLPNEDFILCDDDDNALYDDSTLHVINGGNGKERFVQRLSGYYDGFKAGLSRVVGIKTVYLATAQGTLNYWGLDWWAPDGTSGGGFRPAPDPEGYGMPAYGGFDVDPAGRIVVGAQIIAPAGTTIDLDPGPGVVPFVTPNSGLQFAIVELEP